MLEGIQRRGSRQGRAVAYNQKVTEDIAEGDIIIARDAGEHLVLRVHHADGKTRLRTLDLTSGKPKNRVWKHGGTYSTDATLNLIAA